MNEHRDLKKTNLLRGVILFLAIFLFQVAVGKLGNLAAGQVDYKAVDPYDVFMGLSIHHAVQMILTLAVIGLIARLFKVDFGFSRGDVKVGMKFLAIFCAAFLGIALVSHCAMYFTGSLPVYEFPLTPGNILGTLGFQLFLSGPSEEILYRALPITLFIFILGRSITLKDDITVEIVAASLLFSVAHIQWSLAPFTINVNYFQLLYAFTLGTIQGIAYQRSRSILYPMLMHSISNVLMVGTGYLFTLLV